MRLVVEARHLVVRLRLEMAGEDAPLRIGREEGQPPARDEVPDERGDEDGLARAGEAGDAEPQRRREEIGDEGTGTRPGVSRRFGEVEEAINGRPHGHSLTRHTEVPPQV